MWVLQSRPDGDHIHAGEFFTNDAALQPCMDRFDLRLGFEHVFERLL
jgi:hypothetical protein